MDINDLARSIFGTSRAGASPPSSTSTVYGTAASDSDGGSVRVYLGADVVADDRDEGADACVEIPTTQQAREGDTVIVTVDGTGHPVVTGVIGAGDMAAADILSVRDGAVAGTSEEYALSQDRTKPPGSGATWSPLVPECPPGSFVWRRSVTTYGDGSTIRGEAVRLSGDDAVSVEVVSDNGFAIRNSEGSLRLTAQVIYGGERITDTETLHAYFGDGAAISWVKVADGATTTIDPDDPHVSNGGWTLTVGAADVNKAQSYAAMLVTA